MEILYVLAFLVSLLYIVLLIRFLWMVPNELRDIKYWLKKFVILHDREEDDDIH